MNQRLYRYKKRMLILCIMLAVVLMITGVSYAVFTSYSSQGDANTLAASCMDLEFNGQNEINLLNTYPISEGEALEQPSYTFTIKNKCDNYIEYYVIASVISTTNKVDSKYVKVSLLGDNDLNGTVINSLESISTPQSLSKYSITENYILKRGDGISKDESRTFNFRMWLDSNNKDIWTREDIEGKDYQVKISVVGTVKTRPKDDLYVAALIDGEESTSFPTTSGYTASVECTRNGKKVNAKESIVWNGTEWELIAKITNGNVRCNAIFNKIELYTFEQRMASLLDSTANNTDWKVTNENGYRFQGTNPENYFCITDGSGTCEEDKLYRIIGMIENDVENDNNKKSTIKLIKSKNYGTSGSQFDDNGDVLWKTATLNSSLNSGDFYANLTQTIKKEILLVKYSQGSPKYDSKLSELYDIEITNGTNSSFGKIGLMNLSDYTSASLISGCDRSTTLGNLAKVAECTSTNWFVNDNYYFGNYVSSDYSIPGEWTITIWTGVDGVLGYGYVIATKQTHNVEGYPSPEYLAVRPVFSILSSLYYTGDGTINNPYRIAN